MGHDRHGSGHRDRPSPAAAYGQWTEACARAGWQPRDADSRETELAPLAEALGRVTAQPVTARWPSPREDCAAMDGIAIAAETATTAEPATTRESKASLRLTPHAFSRIDTGDPLPPGTDTVVMREHVTIEDDGSVLIEAAASLGKGHHVRKQGEDFAKHQVLVPEGRRLRPADLAVAAAAGHAAVTVSRQPLVVVIPTGDEIRPAGAILAGRVPKHGEIIDSNSVWLAARCAQSGAKATVTDIVPDDPDHLAAAIRHAAASADLVLVIAGSSRGRGDYTASVLAQVGGLSVAGVAVRPGHPAILGHAKTPSAGVTPVVGLPGYPIATAVTFELFASPLLAAITGDTHEPQTRPATLTKAWTSNPSIEEWVPVTLSPEGQASPTGHGSSSTSHLAQATAWWIIPAGKSHFEAGAEITVTPWS